MTIDAPPMSPLRDAYLMSALNWQSLFADSLMQAQRNQYQIYAAWQKSLSAVNQDLWDRWVCRFGGGVPLDG